MRTAALLLTFLAAVVHDFGGSSRAPSGLAIEVVRVDSKPFGLEGTFRLVNHSREPFVFRGWTSWPIYTWETSLGAAWRIYQEVFCGTGLTDRTLTPGQSFEFTVPLPPREHLPRGRVRLGVRSRDGRYVVWSPAIDVTTRTAAAGVP